MFQWLVIMIANELVVPTFRSQVRVQLDSIIFKHFISATNFYTWSVIQDQVYKLLLSK